MMSVLQVVKGLKVRIILHSIFHNEDQFPYKISGSLFIRFTCSDVGISCIIMYCEDVNPALEERAG